ncbi:hypothetical protein ACFTZF_43715 [Streptomyces mirabilis]|uniref:hypothetical protein n=2 Tax=Streptomyces TaxID=1883 RepID=UPI00363ECB29
MLAGVFPEYPQRTTAAIGINCTASLPTTLESIWATALSPFLSLHAKMPPLAAKAARAAFAGPTAEATNPHSLEFTNFVLNDDPKSVARALRSILIGRKDEHRRLNTIRNVPVLIIADEEDSQFPVHVVRKMADAIEGSTCSSTPLTSPPARTPKTSTPRSTPSSPPCPLQPDQESTTMTDNAQATAVPGWVLKFMDAIDTLEFSEGFAPLTEDTDMFFGTAHIHGVEAIKEFFVKIDAPLNITHEVLEFWTAGDGVRLLRGEATMARKSEPDQAVRAPFMHIFYLDQEEPVRIRTLRITAGPLQTDAVM